MSKISTNELIKSFPYALSGNDKITMLAVVVAEAMMKLYSDNNILFIFSMIDRLDEKLLDILASDFKVDWWDFNASVEDKRAVFKSHFGIHRKLGTAGAVKNAISSIYESATISEWFDYGGLPYHYKIDIDLGIEFSDYDKFRTVLQNAKIYANQRSILDTISFSSSRKSKLYVGTAVQYGINQLLLVEEISDIALTWYVDESGSILVDEDGNILVV